MIFDSVWFNLSIIYHLFRYVSSSCEPRRRFCPCHPRMASHMGSAIKAQAVLTFVKKQPLRLLKVYVEIYFQTRLIQRVTQGCSKTEMAFATALRISIRLNLIIQEFSCQNCPLAFFTIVISWDFSAKCEWCAWGNRPFGVISQKHPLRICFRHCTQTLVQQNFIFASYFLRFDFLQIGKLMRRF